MAERTSTSSNGSVFILGADSHCSTTPVLLGVIEMIERGQSNLGYFRPINGAESAHRSQVREGQSESSRTLTDPHVALVEQSFRKQRANSVATSAVSMEMARDLVNADKLEELLDLIVMAYKGFQEQHSFVIIEGTYVEERSDAFSWRLNTMIARTLSSSVLLVVDGYCESLGGLRSEPDLFDSISAAAVQLRAEKADLLGVIVNRVEASSTERIRAGLNASLQSSNIPFFGAIPLDKNIYVLQVADIVKNLNATVLYGKDYLHNEIDRSNVAVATLQLPAMLKFLQNRQKALVISNADRVDILMGLLLSRMSNRMGNISGILLTGNEGDLSNLQQFLDGIQSDILSIPILYVSTDTYKTVCMVHTIRHDIIPASPGRLERTVSLFEDNTDIKELQQRLLSHREIKMTPKMFMFQTYQQARRVRKHIVLPEGSEKRVLLAANDVIIKGLAQITLLGKTDEIQNTARLLHLGGVLKSALIINPVESPMYPKFVEEFRRMRKGKGITDDIAKELMADVSYFGVMLVQSGYADGMVSGAVHTTAATVRPALQIIKTYPSRPLVSSVFFMLLEDQVLVYGDCAINTDPNSEQLATIALSSAETAESFGIPPVVAMLSYATGDSNSGPLVEKVSKAAQIARKARSNLNLYGPIQYDAATNLLIAKAKLKKDGTEVGGKASVLIFPDLNTGNNTYKAVQQSTSCVAIGPILQGLKKPVNDLSRGATVKDIVNTIVITCIQAQAALSSDVRANSRL